MGSSASKPAANAPPHEWKGSAPTGASQDLVDFLQSSKETDASRSKLVELHIESRVGDELKKLEAKQAAALKEAQSKLAAQPQDASAETGDLSRHTVSKEVEALKIRLQNRKTVRDIPESVDVARNEVVRCLRENDRRPLDCWKEVQAFKDEVRRLEKEWIEKAVS